MDILSLWDRLTELQSYFDNFSPYQCFCFLFTVQYAYLVMFLLVSIKTLISIYVYVNKICFFQISMSYTHIYLTALFLGLPGWAGTRKVKPIWILLKQETVSGSGISWAICKYAPRSRQITMPAPHHLAFLQTGCPSCHPTNDVKALKGCSML